MAKIDLGDVQGNILRAYDMKLARYQFYRVVDADAALAALLRVLDADATTGWDGITSARTWPQDADGNTIKPASTLNIAFSFHGLRELGLPWGTLSGFATAFQEGMRSRSGLLGDDGDSAVEHWDEPWRSGDVHMLITMNAESTEALDARAERLAGMIEGAGFERLGEPQDAHKLKDAHGDDTHKEHFGYTDGLGNPHIEGSGQPRQTRTGRLDDNGEWIPLANGEFLLGHANEGREVTKMPRPPEFARNGTFMAYLKLHQHVAKFRRFLAEEGARYAGGEEMLAAKLVGRWRDGTPLALSPYKQDRPRALDNSFTYKDDPEGVRCPLGAHIRRANPRAALGFNGKLVNRHRIIRRGLPYGEQLPDGVLDDDGKERGIIFMALNADLERQFEFVLRQWMNYGNEFGQGNDKDVLIGNNDGDGRMLIQGDPGTGQPPHICTGLPRFVSPRGGEYFFSPSISGMRLLAMGQVEDI